MSTTTKASAGGSFANKRTLHQPRKPVRSRDSTMSGISRIGRKENTTAFLKNPTPINPNDPRHLCEFDGSQAPGRYEIDGDRVFALVQKYTTKPVESALYEAHRRYSDIQFIFSGRETILWAPLAAMSEQTMPYDEAKDAALW
ncbi:MAG: DUF386 domain-containing protein, partial [Proteobacteria bacterium]|nr:DUF386 domain-containing protein [Pseudomonadota bacterium]